MASKIDDWFIWIEANRDTPTRQWTEEVLPQAKATLLADMLELVGEDDHKWLQATPSQRTVSESLNALRQELRDKLKEYYGETNG